MYNKIKKIQWPENYKRIFTLEDLEACKTIEKNLRENSDGSLRSISDLTEAKGGFDLDSLQPD